MAAFDPERTPPTGLRTDELVLRPITVDDGPRTVFVVSEPFSHQVRLLDRTDLTLRFTLREPDKAGTFLVSG